MSLGSDSYYLRLSAEDYYLEGGEPPGRWLGGGARALGLSGNVAADQLKAFFTGYGLDGEALVRNAGITTGKLKRKPGWDLTFSAPKSVSLLWSQLDENSRRKIQEAQLIAVERALSFVEERATFARRGRGGDERIAAKLVAAAFEHSTSRALDPQLHTHCLLLNLGVCDDGKIRALLSKPFYHNKMLAGAVYRLELAHRLNHTLGLETFRKDSCFEVAGVPDEVLTHFSKRRQQIETELGEMGVDTASAAAYATLKTRQVKDLVPPRRELLQRWKHEALREGFGAAHARRLVGGDIEPPQPAATIRRALHAAIARVESNRSYTSSNKLLLETAHQLQGSGVPPDELFRRFEEEVQQAPGLRKLGVRNGISYLATERQLRSERGLLDTVAKLQERRLAPIAERFVDELLTKSVIIGPQVGKKTAITLSDEQQQAVRHLVLGDSPLKVVTGIAGSGKTAMLAATRQAFERAGYQVIGATPTHRARQELANGAGIDSDTIRKRLLQLYPTSDYLLRHHARQLVRAARRWRTHLPDQLKLSHKTVLVVDEASMAATEDMRRLLQAVHDQGGRIVFVGDDRQLPPVGPGGAFGAIIRRVGSVDLTDVTRQREPWARQATQSIATGDVESFLTAYASNGWLTTEKDRQSLERSLLSDWQAAGGAAAPEQHIIAASTNEQVDRYNSAAQQLRLEAGLLGKHESLDYGSECFYAGDRVTIQKNSRKLRVYNGDTGTILAVKDWGWTKAVAIRLDLPERTLAAQTKEVLKHTAVQLLRAARKRKTYRYDPDAYDIRIVPIRTLLGNSKFADCSQPGQRPAIRLAYAFTTHKLQGATVDHTYVALGDSMTDREMSYVQGSRHHKSLQLYATEAAAGETLTELAKTREAPNNPDQGDEQSQQFADSPLAKEMLRSRRHSLAHDMEHDELPISP
nr:MobF family relaxase [Aeoliella straminimaris]